jgi:hypothetical protein
MSFRLTECWSSALRPEPSMVFSGALSAPLELEAVTVMLARG